MKNIQGFQAVASEVKTALKLEQVPDPGTAAFEPFLADLEAKGHALYAALLRQSAAADAGTHGASPTPPRTLKARFRSAFDGLKRGLVERESPFGETVPNKRLAGIALVVVPVLALGVYAYGYYSQPSTRTNATGGLLSGLASRGTDSSSDLAAALPVTPSSTDTAATTPAPDRVSSRPAPKTTPNPKPTAQQRTVRQTTANAAPQPLIEAPPSDTPPEVFRRPSRPTQTVSSAPNWRAISQPVVAQPRVQQPRLEASSAARTGASRSGYVSASASRNPNPVAAPTSVQFGDESSADQTESATDRPRSSGIVYNGVERPSDAASGEGSKSQSGLLYDGATRDASATGSAASGSPPANPPTANAPESRAFVPTETINATLVLNIEVLSGSSAPVVASSSEGNWIGTATLALDRVQIQFTHLVREGQVREVYGLAYDLESSQGLVASVADVAPNLVPDLLRNGANALNTYAQGLLNGQTTTSAGGVTVSSGNAVGLGTVIAGALGQTFKLPDGSQSFYRIGRISKGTPFMVLVGLGGQK